jgi:spermidine/putrescine transport system permease protein
MNKKLAKLFVMMPPVGYLILFFVIPTLIMVLASFRPAGEYAGLAPLFENDSSYQLNLTFSSYLQLFEDNVYLALFLKSFLYALLTTTFCLLIAYPMALVIVRAKAKHRDLLLLLVILPFWSNFLIRIYAWMIILSPGGALGKLFSNIGGLFGLDRISLLFSPFAVVVCLVYVNLPFMILPLYTNLEKHDPALLDAAQDLGARTWHRFRYITLPQSLPGIYAGAALVFIPALGMFAVPDILGGTNGMMIGNLIKSQFLDTRDWPFGSVLSIALTFIALAFVGVAAVLAKPRRAMS